ALLLVIAFSIVVIMLESIQEVDTKYHSILFITEWVITIIFTLEYLLRLWVSDQPKKYAVSFFGVVDLLSILPTYAELFVTGVTAFSMIRAIRLLRVFRVLKLVQYIGEAQILFSSLKASLNKITVFLSFVIISCTIIGTLMYVVEGPESGFTSIPRSVYWAVVTLTTVGYGDISPASGIGQLLAMILMILGYGVIAVPTGLVTAEVIQSGRVPFKPSGETQVCKNCQSEIKIKDALFCHHCGQALN
ncbi:MAG: ion transporter, partial [Luteibaculum sp.]